MSAEKEKGMIDKKSGKNVTLPPNYAKKHLFSP
jgi:hypothetical protein